MGYIGSKSNVCSLVLLLKDHLRQVALFFFNSVFVSILMDVANHSLLQQEKTGGNGFG